MLALNDYFARSHQVLTGTSSLAESDAALQTMLDEILAQKTVYRVASEADVPAMLASLGIPPQAMPMGLLNVQGQP